jgi:AcrR family transcriptional regulator
MSESQHPTAQQLMDTVSVMLDGSNPHDILVDEVLRVSGVSRGSLYHHFGDFPRLINATLLHRFSVNVKADAEAMMAVAESASSKEDYWERIRLLSAMTQVPERAPIRAERARIISMASSDATFGKALSVEQDRLTTAMADSIALAQKNGWVNPHLSAHAIAVFLQAYSLGRSVDDISNAKVANSDWISLIERIFEPLIVNES